MTEAGAYIEAVGNLHIHTRYSDGSGTHEEIAAAAERAGLDFIITTDHNVFVPDKEGWYGRVLVLVGEEINEPQPPQANHLLCFRIRKEVRDFAGDAQALIDEVRRQGGFCFPAHPLERPSPLIGEPAFNWNHWDADGYAGICLWNYMSEFKSYLTSVPRALLSVFFPEAVIRGPFPEALQKYDTLLAHSRRLRIIGGSDAHANRYSLGPIPLVVFPYERLFRTVNLHVLLRRPLSGGLLDDRDTIYEAIEAGRSFIGYHRLGDPRGFQFHASDGTMQATYGETIETAGTVMLEARSPLPARLRLIRHGEIVAERWGKYLSYRTEQPGAYRLEAWRWGWGRWRGWVFTNPIFVTEIGRQAPAGALPAAIS
jgi:hypothetical protein